MSDTSPTPTRHDTVHDIDGPLKQLVDANFLSYASYVIRDRAIPDIDDGLKPVQRRILHSLNENDDGKFIKVANIVGYTMQFHPHGDASIADALVTLTNRGYLIEGQGNFGNIFTGDPAAASRYIECRLTELGRSQLFNDKTTRYTPTYDSRKKEPIGLPAKLPLLLMLGAEGIAVGLATRILPHNLTELLEAQIACLKKEPFQLFPDFQQGGLMDATEYDNGRGRVKVRARIEKTSDSSVSIKEIPFGTTTDSVISSIEEAVRKKKLKISSIDDFTAGHVEIEVKLTEGQTPDKAINALYAFTQCEIQVSSHPVVICKGRPTEMTVSEILEHNTRRLVSLLERELRIEHRRLAEDKQRKTLVQIFVENRIYKLIEECETFEAVKASVSDAVSEYRSWLDRDVTDTDVDYLLDIPIKRISRFDLEKNREEIEKIVKDMTDIDAKIAKIVPHAIRYLRSLIKKYGEKHPRSTAMTTFEAIELRKLTATDLTICHDKERGYVGHAVSGPDLLHCSPMDKLVILSRNGTYRVVTPPDKLFVRDELTYCAVYNRNRIITVLYALDGMTYAKRFRFGGAILSKEYSCLEDTGSAITFIDDTESRELYVRFHPSENTQIHQQVFALDSLPPKKPSTRGTQMTAKEIQLVSGARPDDWDDEMNGPPGAFIRL